MSSRRAAPLWPWRSMPAGGRRSSSATSTPRPTQQASFSGGAAAPWTGSASATRTRGETATAVSRRIDYVLVRAGRHGAMLQVVHCDRLLDQPVGGVWASDHYGVVADLVTPRHPPGTWEDAGQPDV